MLEFQQDNQFFLFNLTENQQRPFHFLNRLFGKTTTYYRSAKGRGTTYFLNTEIFCVNTALRHYYRGGLWGKCNKDRYRFQSFTETRSVAEFQLLNQLHQWCSRTQNRLLQRVKKAN